ncbi:MAG: GntR family transcriptional regulator [Oscillospiraceae bacterium]|nr:GntR family transcriptional regulator [Oscillospiraceae bacterium]
MILLFVEIDEKSEIPIYRQLKTSIISAILSGGLKEGDRLPSVRQLGSDLGINLHTVNKVYNILKDEGYINFLRNQGAYVNAIPKTCNNEDLMDFEKKLQPIIIEMRAKNIGREQFDEIMDLIWNHVLEGGKGL